MIKSELIESDSCSQPPMKRRRTFVTAGQKHAICQYKELFPRVSIQAIMSWTKDNLGIELGRSTVSDILRDKDKWLAADSDSTKVRCQSSQLPQLEDALYSWFQEAKANGIPPTDSMLIEKAKSLGTQLDVPANFSYSKGWLYKVKKRKKMSPAKTERSAILTGRMDYQAALESYELDDMYNLDELCLLYRTAPDNSGTKGKTDKIVVALVCNASGTDMRRPIVVGPSQASCFPKGFNPNVYVDYLSEASNLLTIEIFREIVRSLDQVFRSQSRHCILLLDDSPCHAANTGLELTNLTLLMIPESVASQPLELGIIRTFKGHYRSLLVRHFLACCEEDRSQEVDLRQALALIRRAWRSVPHSTVRNCWQRTRTGLEDDMWDEITFEEDNIEEELQQLLDTLKTGYSAEAYIDCDKDEATCEETVLSSVQLVKVEPSDVTKTELTPEIPPAMAREAREGLRAAIKYFEILEDTETLDELGDMLDRIQTRVPHSPDIL